jgi:hypothetical protein
VVAVVQGMDDSLPITNNPLLPFFPTVRKDSDKSSPLTEEPKQSESVIGDLQHGQDSLANTNDAELVTSLDKW